MNKRLGDENWNKTFLNPNTCKSKKSHEDRNVWRMRWMGGTRNERLTITATAQISPASGARSLPSPAPRAIPQICWCLHCSLYAEETNTRDTHIVFNMKPEYIILPSNCLEHGLAVKCYDKHIKCRVTHKFITSHSLCVCHHFLYSCCLTATTMRLKHK